jgi:hypothetical protein
MTTRRFRYELALLTILCVVGLFLFPAAVGSYTSVHGPVSALLAVRAAMKVLWAMALAGLGFSHFFFKQYIGPVDGHQFQELIFASPPDNTVSLRC